MGRPKSLMGLLLLTAWLVWAQYGEAKPILVPDQSTVFNKLDHRFTGEKSTDVDSLRGLLFLDQMELSGEVEQKGSVGLLSGTVQSGSNAGIGESDFIFGIYYRRQYGDYFFGDARAAIGIVTDPFQKVRIIPVEYRLNLRFKGQSGSGSGGYRPLSPYLYAGVGLLYHKTLEVNPPVDPRLGRLDGRLPTSSLFEFDDGVTPVIPVGIGVDILLDPAVNLTLQAGYQRVMNRFALSGNAFKNHYLGLSIGLNFRSRNPSRPIPQTQPAPPPFADRPKTGGEDLISDTEEKITEMRSEKSLAADTVAPRSAPSADIIPGGMRVDTLESGRCQYSVQIGSFRTFQGAIQAVDEFTTNTGQTFEIWFNRRNRLYMVRTRGGETLAEASRQAVRFEHTSSLTDIAVLSQCYAENSATKSQPLQFRIQIASFHNRSNAQRFAAKVQDTHQIQVIIQETESSDLYRVKTNPYGSVLEARKALNILRSKGVGNDLFLSAEPETKRFSMEFDQNLQVGIYYTLQEAVRQSDKILTELGHKTRIVVEDEDTLHLFLEDTFKEWVELLNVKNKLEASGFITQSVVIHLTEQ